MAKNIQNFGIPLVEKYGEPTLPPYSLKEYVEIPEQNFEPITNTIELEQWEKIGKISCPKGIRTVCRAIDGNVICYGVLSENDTQLISYIVFAQLNNVLLMAKAARTDKDYQKLGIASELMAFVISTTNMVVLSDTEMSKSGVALWQSLIKSDKLNHGVYDYKTGDGYPTNYIGKQTTDGVVILDPSMDNKSIKTYRDDNISGQRFFWFLVSKPIEESVFKPNRHIGPFSFPPMYFGKGYE